MLCSEQNWKSSWQGARLRQHLGPQLVSRACWRTEESSRFVLCPDRSAKRELGMKGAGRRHYGAMNGHNLCKEWWQGQRLQLHASRMDGSTPGHSQQARYQEENITDASLSQPGCFFTVSWQISIETLPCFYSWMEKGASSYALVFPRGEASPFFPQAAAPGKGERRCVLRRCLRTARNRHGKLPKDVWGHSQNPLVTHDPPCPYFRSSQFTAGRTRNKTGKQNPKEI